MTDGPSPTEKHHIAKSIISF